MGGTEGCRKLHNEKRDDFLSSQNDNELNAHVQEAWHETRMMWDIHWKFYSGKHKRRCDFWERWVEMRIILKEIGSKMWTEFLWLGMKFIPDSCEYGNEPSIFLKGEEFVEYMSDYLMFRNSSASQSSFTKVIVNPV